MQIFDLINFFPDFGPRIHTTTIDPYFPRGFEIRGGAIRITNLIAGLFECLHKSFAYLFAQGNSFIYWHFDRGARTRLLCSAYSDFTVASFPIGLSLRTMQDLGSV